MPIPSNRQTTSPTQAAERQDVRRLNGGARERVRQAAPVGSAGRRNPGRRAAEQASVFAGVPVFARATWALS